jgi:hypothetical protein
MTSHDTLVLIAELAVAIAGFSGVVVALEGRGVGEWSATQRFNLRVLLQVSALTIFFSIFPLILERAIEQPVSWRIALWAYGLVHLADIISFIAIRPPGVVGIRRVAQLVGLALAIVSLSVAAFGSFLATEIFYLSMLVWHLGVSAMGFASLIFDDSGRGAARQRGEPEVE